MPALNNACEVLFLVSGEAKAPVLRDVLEGDRDVERLPAQAVELLNGELLWLVDKGAASELR
jgi:6-phosphogluconolactonase